ncbi:CobW family GTP-binding protein [Pandoraea pneumonica]|uniref:CobW family GTP-binding protein n=1 Tax=Pandoraea pneumonica TaxID=2508299 RepID=UPI003CF8FF7C
MTIRRVPATVVTGFLGAGKTTFVNHLLNCSRERRIGIVVNEFGDIGIDGELIVAEENAIVEISNGCVCCTVRGDLVTSIVTLLDRYGNDLDHLIVETSGLADPAPVLQTFLADAGLRERVELNSVVVLVDALHAQEQLNDDIASEQVAVGDRIVLNKTREASPEAVDALCTRLRQLNPAATIDLTNHAKVDADSLFSRRTFSIDHLLSVEPDLLTGDDHDHEHDTRVQSCGFRFPEPLDAARFERWANQLVQRRGASLLRMKGVLNLNGEGRRVIFHSVHMLMETRFDRPWNRDVLRETRFVVIGRDLDVGEIGEGLRACAAAI